MAATDHLVDFEAVVLDLRRRGWTYRAIANRIDVSETSVKRYMYEAARPPHEAGEMLIELWMGVTLSAREQLPKITYLRGDGRR